MRRRIGLLSIAFICALGGTAFATPMKHDTDSDGTLDAAEMEAAASTAFDKLNADSDTTLDYGEAKGHLNKKAFIAADPDKDATLSKDEYIGMAQKLFKAADENHDGTLTPRELKSRAGRALMRLLQ